MKKIIMLSVCSIAFLGACKNSSNNASSKTTQTFALDTTKLAKGELFYQCEMHPGVISDKPGECPTCGMDLEKIEKK